MISQLFSPQRWQKGKYTGALEAALVNYLSVPYAFSLASEEAVLGQILRGWEIGNGDKVVVSPFSPAWVIKAVRKLGSEPCFVDIEERTFNLDVERMKELPTGGVKAVVISHTFGQAANLGEAIPWARSAKIKVVEDCSHAFGARYRGELLGTFGDAAIFSLGADSSLAAIAGGAAAISDPRLARTFAAARGRLPLLPRWSLAKGIFGKLPEIDSPYCLPNIWAEAAYRRFAELDEQNHRQREVAAFYLQRLRDIPVFKLPGLVAGAEPSFRFFAVTVPDPERLQRSARRVRFNFERECGAVACSESVLQTALGYDGKACPAAEKAATQLILLPTTVLLAKARKVVKVVREHYSGNHADGDLVDWDGD